MTKQEIENKIKELQALIDNKEYDSEIWKPEVGDYYYRINTIDDEGVETRNCNDSIDTYCLKTGNYYKTREKAEFEAQREKYTRLFRKYIEENSEPCDWCDEDESKHFLYYDTEDKIVGVNDSYVYREAFQIYASNEQVLWGALNFIGEDNFKKYILEIEDEQK